jgi:TPR repeat protein
MLLPGACDSSPSSEQALAPDPARPVSPWPAPHGDLDPFAAPAPMSPRLAKAALDEHELQHAYLLINQRDADPGVKLTVDLAETGNPAAQTAACVDFRTGTGANPDDGRGRDWCREAAAQGYALGEYELGRIYYRSDSAFNAVDPAHEDEALHWLTLAAQQHMYQADFALTRAYAQGDIVGIDRGQALTFLAAGRQLVTPDPNKPGRDVSCRHLPDYLAARYGLGRTQDIAAAKTALLQAVAEQCWPAQQILASLYHYGVDGFPQDGAAALAESQHANVNEVAYVYGVSPAGWRP